MLLSLLTKAQIKPRSVESFNKNWKFFLGDEPNAKNASFISQKWRSLTLPHDWSIEGSFSEKNPSTANEGALPTGIGWYRKTFTLPASAQNKNIYIDFDGIYRNSEVWINGHYLGKRPNGYISFRYNLTRYAVFNRKKNVIAVKVDNSEQPNSRWYSGSGIYQNVWLVTTNKISIDHWGTFVTTPKVSQESATINLKISIRNSAGKPQNVNLETTVFDAEGKKVVVKTVSNVLLKDSVTEVSQGFDLNNPKLWSVEKPEVYRIQTKVIDENSITDVYETPLGIRYFNFDAKTGFSLNGKPMKILGVCLHHDLGALGAAFNTRAAERQLEILKAMGCNAIRTSHNPPAPELLDLCDKMGFLVMDEAFDQWKKKKTAQDYHLDFAKWHQQDLEDQIKRDRNHPSVFIWSIGNEIREQFDESGTTIVKELAAIVKNLDTTRPVTSALTEMEPDKNFVTKANVLDVLGFNYKHEEYGKLPASFPGQKFIASETTSALETRGHYDMPSDSVRFWPADGKHKFEEHGNVDLTVSAYDNVAAYWGTTHEEAWKAVKKLDYMSGLFVWTGFDYLGEPTPYPYPARSSYFGIVDLAGFPKDIFYMYQSEWTERPVLHLLPHWNWTVGKIVDVWAYYNQADEVELFLNGKSLGVKKKIGNELHVMWRVKFEPGTIEAISRQNGKIILTDKRSTAGKPARIELSADRKTIKADGKDLSFITVKVLDAQGNLVPDAANLINFKITGEGFIAGVDNGLQTSLEPFKASYRRAFNGLCLAIIQAKEKAGKISLTASAAGLQTAVTVIESK
jgi:beta-galactosidase